MRALSLVQMGQDSSVVENLGLLVIGAKRGLACKAL